MNASSAKQSRGQKVRSDTESNVPDNSTIDDKYQEGTRQREVVKCLRESCYHRIKCFVVNSLTAFMWRRPLNSVTLVGSTHRGFERVSDGTSTQVMT